MGRLIAGLAGNLIFDLVLIAVIMDTIFGAGRAIKEGKFNSSTGIDGAIRKSSMLLSLVFLYIVDRISRLNLVGFVPDEIRQHLPETISTIGLLEFFGLLYIAYEIVSILKNMTLCGLPVKNVWEVVRKFLGKYTEELPSTGEENQEEVKENERN